MSGVETGDASGVNKAARCSDLDCPPLFGELSVMVTFTKPLNAITTSSLIERFGAINDGCLCCGCNPGVA